MTTVWPSAVTTTVSAERMSMTGALTALAEMGTVRGWINGRDLRRNNHLHQAIGGDERRDLQDDAHIRIGNRVDGVAESVITHAGDQGNLLADGDGGRLVVAGEDGRARQHLGVASLGNGVQGHLVVLAENLVETGALLRHG